MDRRQFCLSAFLAPAVLRGAVGEEPSPGDPDPLRAALRSARVLGKPLVCLVVPTDADERVARGRALGRWLDARDARTLLQLSRAEVACFPLARLRREVDLFDLPEPWRDEPWVVLVETAPARPRGACLTARLAQEDATSRARRSAEAELTRVLTHALAGDDVLRRRRAAECTATLDEGEVRARPGVELAGRLAPILLEPTAEGDHLRASDAATLRSATARRLLRSPLVGATWNHHRAGEARTNACAEYGTPCGTAHCPPAGKRFLTLLTEIPDRDQ